MSRVIMHRSLHDELMQRVINIAQFLEVSDALNFLKFGSNMGAMVSDAQLKCAVDMAQSAKKEWVKLIAGGHKLNREGAFMEPTIVSCDPNHAIAQDEVFDPVLSIMPFENDQEAIEIANSTEYGLAAGVFTKDIGRVKNRPPSFGQDRSS